jgi:uroporphyrin-III C-methyltransferase/precorrin-2 dehydrogenase/sirohydrochlorin ferrochelatase
MDYLPVFMNMHDRSAIIVGGGIIASRKAALIASSGARITVVSPDLSVTMRTAIDSGGYYWIDREFMPADLDTACLVVAATDDLDTNRQVHAAATERRIPVNVVDTPALCTFILPAIVDRSPAVIAVSTGGRSPVLARFVKSLLERTLPARLGRLAEICGELRSGVAARITDPLVRRRYWEQLLEGDFPDLVCAGNEEGARRRARANLDSASHGSTSRDSGTTGAVYLIGAGPGDPELLTLKAQRLLQRADVVLYDRLVPVGILAMCRREAELVYVGKRNGDHPVPQEQIGKLLVRYAKRGMRVARLKGGDPFIFGRGGEELEALATAGIDFQVVPGISAANGAASYAGIPLTHRDHAQSVSFWTGHTRDGKLDLDWHSMSRSRQTLVFFMSAANLAEISQQLIASGMAATMPAAVIQAATTPRQTVMRTSLRKLGDVGNRLDRSLPTLIVIGTVVNLRRNLDWFHGNSGDAVPVFPPHLSSAASTSSEHDAA